MRFLGREQWQMVAVLAVVAVSATLVLGVADLVTRAPIAEAKREALHRALVQVLPAHANDPLNDTVRLAPDGEDAPARIFLARDDAGGIHGVAYEVVAPDGYAGSIRILMGVRPDGRIHAIRVTEHRETPGLGDGIARNEAWIASFSGRTLEGARWAVKKDGGDFDQFTGATISPRAVVKAVKRGLQFFHAHRGAILADRAKEDRHGRQE